MGPGYPPSRSRSMHARILLPSREVDELAPTHHGRTIRVHGWVAPGATDLVAKCPDDYSTLPSWPERGGPR